MQLPLRASIYFPDLNKELANFSPKEPRVNTLRFADYTNPVSTTQLCYTIGPKAAKQYH